MGVIHSISEVLETKMAVIGQDLSVDSAETSCCTNKCVCTYKVGPYQLQVGL